ncbi:MAG: DUF1727 domain-containing protein [Oscillospiraceae bacterium]|nr:DUF1727 domain-containing protein [Oscillospiraceae bacterium]
MRFYIALWIAKITGILLRIASRFTSMRGTNFPGEVAIRICPDFIGRINKPDKIAVVTGTNGKTTTSNLISSALEECGYNVLSNKYGSNIKSGIATALINGVTWANKSVKEIALLEVDERSSVRVYPFMKPDYVICTNLSRDTIMRNAHPYYIFNMLDTYIPDSATMILNADDVISSRLKINNKRVYYGFDQQPGDPVVDRHLVNDAKVCPECGSLLQYNYLKYDHIGNAYCPDCGYHSPAAEFSVESVDVSKNTMTVRAPEGRTDYHLISDTTFNIYNEVAAVTFLTVLGVPQDKIQNALSKVTIVDSRLREETYSGIRVSAIMSKGLTPACNAVLDYTISQPGDKEVVLYLEDKHELAVSSERITWIWDSDFEMLKDKSVKTIIITGFRRFDFYYRLLLADIPKDKIVLVEEPRDVADAVTLDSSRTIFILNDIYSVAERDLMIDMIRERIEKEIANAD